MENRHYVNNALHNEDQIENVQAFYFSSIGSGLRFQQFERYDYEINKTVKMSVLQLQVNYSNPIESLFGD